MVRKLLHLFHRGPQLLYGVILTGADDSRGLLCIDTAQDEQHGPYTGPHMALTMPVDEDQRASTNQAYSKN